MPEALEKLVYLYIHFPYQPLRFTPVFGPEREHVLRSLVCRYEVSGNTAAVVVSSTLSNEMVCHVWYSHVV